MTAESPETGATLETGVTPGAEIPAAASSAVGPAEFPTARDHLPGAVHHVVLFKLVDDTDEVAAEITRRFLALAGSERDGVPYIQSISGGRQISPEPGASAQLGFVVIFGSVGDRNFYLGEPFVADGVEYDLEHDAFKKFVGPLLAPDGVEIFDFQQ